MLFKKIVFIFLFSASCSSLSGAHASGPHAETNIQKFTHFARFFDTIKLPECHAAAIAYCLSSKEGQHALEETTPWKIADFPLYLKGDDLSRIINAQRIKNCIKAHNLYHLEVPDKYLEKVGPYWRVFVQEVQGSPINGRRFCKTMAEQLIIFAQETGFSDWGFISNWLWKDGCNTLVCIDTEDLSFSFFSGLEALQNLKDQWGKSFSKDSLQLLEQKIEELSLKPQPACLQKYDDPKFSMAEVWNEFERLKKEQS